MLLHGSIISSVLGFEEVLAPSTGSEKNMHLFEVYRFVQERLINSLLVYLLLKAQAS